MTVIFCNNNNVVLIFLFKISIDFYLIGQKIERFIKRQFI